MMDRTMKRCLVLGSTGFIGRHLADSLSENYTVIGYCSPKNKGFIDVPYEVIFGDYTKEYHFEEILRDFQIDTIFHLISTGTPQEGTACFEKEMLDSIAPTIRLLEAMAGIGHTRIVFASSGGTVYGEGNGKPHREDEVLSPVCGYGVQKAAVENILRLYEHEYKVQCLIARISNVYGYDRKKDKSQGIIPIVLRHLFAEQGITLFGDTVRDYVYIEDVVRALICMGNYAGRERVFNIASGEPISLSNLVELLELTTGRRFSQINRQPIRTCDVAFNSLSIDRAVNELGWRPEVQLKDGLNKLIREFSSEIC